MNALKWMEDRWETSELAFRWFLCIGRAAIKDAAFSGNTGVVNVMACQKMAGCIPFPTFSDDTSSVPRSLMKPHHEYEHTNQIFHELAFNYQVQRRSAKANKLTIQCDKKDNQKVESRTHSKKRGVF